MINPAECFFGIEAHATLDKNPGPVYNNLTYDWFQYIL